MVEAARRERRLTFEDVASLSPQEQPGELVRGAWVPVTRNVGDIFGP